MNDKSYVFMECNQMLPELNNVVNCGFNITLQIQLKTWVLFIPIHAKENSNILATFRVLIVTRW